MAHHEFKEGDEYVEIAVVVSGFLRKVEIVATGKEMFLLFVPNTGDVTCGSTKEKALERFRSGMEMSARHWKYLHEKQEKE